MIVSAAPTEIPTKETLSPGTLRLVILILGALSTVTPVSIDMYLPALPQIATSLHCTTAQVSLSLSSYFIGMAMGQLLYGPLLDRYGRKRPIYFGLGLYLLCSLACVVAPTVGILIGLRFFQALGACVSQVAAMTMVRDFFPPKESARVFSLQMLILGVSPLLAPTLGSLITVHLGWHWIFLALAIIVGLILAATAAFLPQVYRPDPTVILRPKPIIDQFLVVLQERRYVTYVFAGACSFSGLFVYVAGSPIILMESFHVSAKTYGILFAIMAMGFIGGNQLNILALRSFSSERIFAAALVIQVLNGALFSLGAYLGLFNLDVTVTLLFLQLLCFGFTFPNASALALASISRNIGSAAALMGFMQTSFGALASSCIGLLNVHTVAPVIFIMTGMAGLGLAILVMTWRPLPGTQPI